jgi:hypothetical protein
MAFVALFGRCPTDLAVVLGIARYFSQEGATESATRPRRTQLTCGKRLASRMKNPAIGTAAVEERHSDA